MTDSTRASNIMSQKDTDCIEMEGRKKEKRRQKNRGKKKRREEKNEIRLVMSEVSNNQ